MLQIDEISTGGLEVKFEYKPWLVSAIKEIPGARFIPVPYKHWFIPEHSKEALINWAKTIGFTSEGSKHTPDNFKIDPLPELEIDIPLKTELFPFQKNGIAYALKKQRLIIGDQPGLGKTAQAIATLEAAGCKCILVICPATLKTNWKIEIEQIWTNKKALILSDKVKATWPTFYKVGMVNYFIVNFESLKKYFVQEINTPEGKPLRLNHIVFRETIDLFDAVIIDESHRCKEGKTQTAKFTMGISRGKPWILALTGTPVVNKPIDLIPQLYIIGRLDDFGGYKGFTNRYCMGYNQASNLKELNFVMNKNCFYRRLKQDVLKDLPAKMRNIVRTDITNRRDYDKAENDLVKFLKENLGKSHGEITKTMRGEAMVLIGILKKISARGKVEDVLEHIQEVVEAGEKIVVFAWHKDIVRSLCEAIPGALTITGDDSEEARNQAIYKFQNIPKSQVIICNIKSGGVGITLTASSRVLFIELPWNPATSDQCEDRCHRIGQKDSVQCTYFLGHNTIDDYIYGIIQKKRAMVDQVTGSEEEIETNVIDEFINLFSKDKGITA